MIIKYVYIPNGYTNCYILADEKTKAAAIIDPGDTVPEIKELVKKDNLDVRAIFLTHGHYDHVGGVAALRKKYKDIPVYLHPEDAGKDTELMPTRALDPVTLWRDGDVVMVGELQVEVLHTPGHSAGSVTLRCQDVLFTGDTLFTQSVGRTDFPGGSQEALMASLKRLGELEGDYQVLPGHDTFTSLDQERQGNPYLKQALKG
ncbi:MAG: MBL fold metallo-hydrolase [Oscillospiraceae bacterium]|jgi:hydroxyacylglutathione hydrolase|nr:MBL fold metallo-hydrolase [Oscillospiraceae bacterium]